uniref:SPX domain-containing protein n=1 Tax=Rhizochromulina marina TaxID=1034831 RepID=A0A7S2WKV1_9STRA|mmetsp:Transcript_266/g.867  ORF Transcript_266/g.867 Transcript_266/m.867 type:complete len:715 (+) Transcript_266:89-2233(+)
MKFGQHLEEHKLAEWDAQYMNYRRLKKMITVLKKNLLEEPPTTWDSGVSLSTAPPTNAAAMPVVESRKQAEDEGSTDGISSDITQDDFFQVLETEMTKVASFTQHQVRDIRKAVANVDSSVSEHTTSKDLPLGMKEQLDAIGEHFLRLEKFVNLNFTGFRKILKKHDKNLPNPATAFYMGRLHQQAWVRGDYSDIIVNLSRLHSILRGDNHLEAQQSATQDFLRKTTKYWIRKEFVTAVKYIVSQRLPVYLFGTSSEQPVMTDAQLVNSVYLDNSQLELYHGRLDKTPGAIAIRLRWYGTGEPELVFVERKTHRDSWTGDVSVKERFIIKPKEVPLLLNGRFPVEIKIQEMRKKGTYTEQEIEDWLSLVTEVTQAINSKQLVPTMRSQYMRTAFQIANDATVRVSLDTNLCMIYERDAGVEEGLRWYRDPNVKVPADEITRFPHAVLEVKLEVAEGNTAPQWVEDLIRSDMVCEVHKFSKFIHGCAVLMPDEVQAVPYWVDDPTLRASIELSGGQALLATDAGRVDANKQYPQLLPHGQLASARRRPAPRRLQTGEANMASTEAALSMGVGSDNAGNETYECYYDQCWNSGFPEVHTVTQKVEPKLHFANERTYIHWLHMAVHLAGLATAVLAFSPSDSLAEVYALLMLPLALVFVLYALFTFHWRDSKITTRQPVRWDDPYGPVIVGVSLILSLSIYFGLQLTEISQSSGSLA